MAPPARSAEPTPGRPRRGSGLDVQLRVRADRREMVLRVCRAQLVGAPPRIEEDVEAGQVLISATFRGLLPARGVLLGFGTDVEVITPDELRREMAATARAVGELYG